jgi:NTE family protein
MSAAPMRDVGLCLSGGGYRAAVYHIGALIRLNQAGLLPRLRTVSSVSGGSIVAAFLGLHWTKLIFDAEGVATNLDAVVLDPVLRFTRHGLDAAAVLSSAFIPGLISRRVQKRYKALFGSATLADLPDRQSGPDFVITATNLSSGALFRFSRRGVGDFRKDPNDTSTGFFQAPTIPLVLAVAASSAFPPILSPCLLDASKYSDARGAQRTVYLTDGGVFDNLGIEPVDDPAYRLVLSSDGGAPFKRKIKPPLDYLGGTVHVLKVVDIQVRKLRRKELIESAKQMERKVAYWALNSTLSEYAAEARKREPDFAVLEVSDPSRNDMMMITTRLAAIDSGQQRRLANWGYACCDTAIRTYAISAPRGAFPYEGGV